MNTYEFTFLIEDSKGLKKIETALESTKGKKLNEESWGKRLLTYPINKITSAEFYTWSIHMDKEMVDEFKKKLNYEKLVMRYLILDNEGNQKTSKKIES